MIFVDKTIKLWKISERNVRIDGPLNTKTQDGTMDLNPHDISVLKIPKLQPTSLMIEASPRKIFSNAHTYHINSIAINSDDETYLSADDLRINLWHLQRTDQSFSILSLYAFCKHFNDLAVGSLYALIPFNCCLPLLSSEGVMEILRSRCSLCSSC